MHSQRQSLKKTHKPIIQIFTGHIHIKFRCHIHINPLAPLSSKKFICWVSGTLRLIVFGVSWMRRLNSSSKLSSSSTISMQTNVLARFHSFLIRAIFRSVGHSIAYIRFNIINGKCTECFVGQVVEAHTQVLQHAGDDCSPLIDPFNKGLLNCNRKRITDVNMARPSGRC